MGGNPRPTHGAPRVGARGKHYAILAVGAAVSSGAPMRNLSIWQAVAFATELGIAFAAAVLLGLFIGRIADDRLGNAVPIFTILGSLIGLAAGVYSSAQIVRYLTRPRKE